MFGLGTIVNTLAVFCAGMIGVTLKKGIPENCRKLVMQCCGLSTIFIGISGVMSYMLVYENGSITTRGTYLLIFSLVFGGAAGALCRIEHRLDSMGELLKRLMKTDGDQSFVEGFTTATLVICVGAMAIVGAIQDGLSHDASTLFAKSVLDFAFILFLASSLGKGVVFSTIPLFCYQFSITVIAALCGNFISDAVIAEISFVGSALIFCVGVNLAFGKKFAIGDMLPAMLVPVLYDLLRTVVK